jgi:hypothetical protein
MHMTADVAMCELEHCMLASLDPGSEVGHQQWQHGQVLLRGRRRHLQAWFEKMALMLWLNLVI